MFKITFEKKAYKILSKLDKSTQIKILKYLNQEQLLKNPRSLGKALLYEKKGNWRYRIEDYRIICKILDKELVVLILDLGHRREIY